MGRALLNIWVRDVKCNLLYDAWRLDLVIKGCNGTYLVDQDEELIPLLMAKYPNHIITKLPNYMGATRISIVPPALKHVYHVEVEVPPGCYQVWARMCHGKNEETNKVLAIAKCGEHLCLNLLLNTPNVCADDGLFPIAINALQRNVGDLQVKEYLQVVQKVAVLKKDLLLARANDRIAELQAGGPTELLAVNEQLRDIVQDLPDDGCCG